MNTSKRYNIEKHIKNAKNHFLNCLNYKFENDNILMESLIHSSLKNENDLAIIIDNEKLEFIGDAVLDLIVSNFLLSYPKYSLTEGSLSINRAILVKEKAVAVYAKKICLEDYILVSRSGKTMEINTHESVLSDAFEALVGAIFMDSSYEICNDIILKTFKDKFIDLLENPVDNYKGMLNELIIPKIENIVYNVISVIGPEHNKEYTSEILINGNVIATGKGNSIKNSEQQAAKKALEILMEDKNCLK